MAKPTQTAAPLQISTGSAAIGHPAAPQFSGLANAWLTVGWRDFFGLDPRTGADGRTIFEGGDTGGSVAAAESFAIARDLRDQVIAPYGDGRANGTGALATSAHSSILLPEAPEDRRFLQNDDEVIYTSASGTFAGGDGNDLFILAAAFPPAGEFRSIDGGAGIDTLDTRAVFADYTINLATGETRYPGAPFPRNETVVNIENLITGAGMDSVTGSAAANEIVTGQGDDTVVAGDGDDVVRGQRGDDMLAGEAGKDRLNGGEGNDFILGGAGADTVYGEDGDDVIWGGDGDDQIWGGTGDDYIQFFTQFFGQTSDGQAGNDIIGDGNDIIGGGDGDDYVAAGEGNDLIYGGAGNDTLWGRGGDDMIFGGDGHEYLRGGAGTDRLFGEGGADFVTGGGGDDFMCGGEGIDNMDGGVGNDQMFGGLDGDWMHGGPGDDLVDGMEGDDNVRGDGGNDTLFGRDGFDFLDGSWGNDKLFGGNDDDTLVGGEMADILNGGAGDDIFVFNTVADSAYGTPDTIQGFEGAGAAGGDVIDLSAIDAAVQLLGNQTFSFRGLIPNREYSGFVSTAVWVQEFDGQTRVYAKVNNGLLPDIEIRINDGPNVHASDYTADDFLL